MLKSVVVELSDGRRYRQSSAAIARGATDFLVIALGHSELSDRCWSTVVATDNAGNTTWEPFKRQPRSSRPAAGGFRAKQP
jgi:hypothetical protein